MFVLTIDQVNFHREAAKRHYDLKNTYLHKSNVAYQNGDKLKCFEFKEQVCSRFIQALKFNMSLGLPHSSHLTSLCLF